MFCDHSQKGGGPRGRGEYVPLEVEPRAQVWAIYCDVPGARKGSFLPVVLCQFC